MIACLLVDEQLTQLFLAPQYNEEEVEYTMTAIEQKYSLI